MSNTALTPADIRAAENWKQITECRLPFDMRDPDPHRNYGIHGVDLRFILQGRRGAVQFCATASCYLPHVQLEQMHSGRGRAENIQSDWDLKTALGGLWATDLGYHSPVPMYDDQSIIQEQCPYLDGKPCYYDGSTLNAEDWSNTIFSVRGQRPEDVLWPMLERYYLEKFCEGGSDKFGGVGEMMTALIGPPSGPSC